jgi:uncharacterized protein
MRPILFLVILIMVLFNACGQSSENLNEKTWVYDYEGVLSDKEEFILDSIITIFEKQTTNEIVIVTVDNIGEFNKMVDYAVAFGNTHGVGKKDKSNGLVILFSKNMRESFLSTGYGTEEILKDEICKNIIDSTMIPYFKNQDYFGGLKAGLEECIIKWK